MRKLVYIDGKFFPKEEAKISVFDHGLLYGDGVFEGIRIYNGRIFCFDEHIDRLYDSAKAIALNIPMTKQEMKNVIIETVRVNEKRDGYIRVCITRGEGDLGLDPRKCNKPTVIIIVADIQLYPQEFYEKGFEVNISSVKRNLPEALNPCIKSMNYLNNILAKIESINTNSIETIMLNKDGYVTECTGENIFIVKNLKLITPPTWIGALPGITRKIVMKLAKEKLKIDVVEDLFTSYDLYTADECFMTGTACELAPITKVDGRMIGDGRPGKITKELIKLFKELTLSSGVDVYVV